MRLVYLLMCISVAETLQELQFVLSLGGFFHIDKPTKSNTRYCVKCTLWVNGVFRSCPQCGANVHAARKCLVPTGLPKLIPYPSSFVIPTGLPGLTILLLCCGTHRSPPTGTNTTPFNYCGAFRPTMSLLQFASTHTRKEEGYDVSSGRLPDYKVGKHIEFRELIYQTPYTWHIGTLCPMCLICNRDILTRSH